MILYSLDELNICFSIFISSSKSGVDFEKLWFMYKAQGVTKRGVTSSSMLTNKYANRISLSEQYILLVHVKGRK